jgi:ATPase subunit of ABC transporter with duplicated ATPase domains
VTEKDAEYVFNFPEPVLTGLSPPILGFHDVDFNYPGGPTLFKGLNFGLVRGRRKGEGPWRHAEHWWQAV